MQLRITHTTGFEYGGTATASFNEARLTPLSQPGQIVAHARVDVSPTPWSYSYRDYWGTQVTAFEVQDPHESLTVVASATVYTNRLPAHESVLSWQQLRDPELIDVHTEYLSLPPRVQPAEDLQQMAEQIAADAVSPNAAARRICGLVNEEMTYQTASSKVDGHAAHAWAARKGVCQDMAHVAIGALRHVGIPARYVSGYLHPSKDPEIGVPVAGESHAWVEWWDDGWRGFDPTNLSDVGNQHVVVAQGRDYDDVKPLKGIFSGSGASDMFIDVEVTRLA